MSLFLRKRISSRRNSPLHAGGSAYLGAALRSARVCADSSGEQPRAASLPAAVQRFWYELPTLMKVTEDNTTSFAGIKSLSLAFLRTIYARISKRILDLISHPSAPTAICTGASNSARVDIRHGMMTPSY